MFYITGDTHGEQGRFALLKEYGEPEWTADDYLIVCGDFGYIFANDERENASLDLTKAIEYYKTASDMGNRKAKTKLAEIENNEQQ